MRKSDYDLRIKNCRNIKDSCSLVLKEQSLNNYFAKNGTGKTTIARALMHAYEGTGETLAALESFDYMDTGDSRLAPTVTCNRKIKQLDVFDKAWVDSHCFKESSVQEGAYELYVRDNNYRRDEKQRDKLLSILESKLDSAEIAQLQQDIALIVKGIGKAVAGTIGKKTQPYKAYKNGVPLEPMPAFLRPITSGMSVSEQAKWLEWHVNHPTMHAMDRCPYCGCAEPDVMAECVEYDDSRDSSSIAAWSRLAVLFDEHSSIFSRKVMTQASRILSSTSNPSADDLEFLCAISASASEVDNTISSMKSALHDDSLLDSKKLIAKLKDCVEILEACDIFRKYAAGNMSAQAKAIWSLTSATRALVAQQNVLDALSTNLQTQAVANVKGREEEINDFLHRCGYRYHIEIATSIATATATILLVADGLSSGGHKVHDIGGTLSYGEKNAFSLALFAIQATNVPGGVVVLDDPISSFDIDKRFGILYMLFSDKSKVFSNNLLGKNKTVLLLTHDYLVVSEVAKITRQQFSNKRKSMWYLCCDSFGALTKCQITDESFAPYTQMLRKRISCSSGKDLIIRLAYIRSLCEMLRNSPEEKRTRWGVSFGLISEILHGRSVDEVLERHDWNCKNDAKWHVRICESLVSELTGCRFDYWSALDYYHDNIPYLLSVYLANDSSYEKLQLVRMMLEQDASLNVLGKVMERFADDSCHIGGDYLYQLDPTDFDQVPFYVREWCDEVADAASLLVGEEGSGL